MKKRVLSILLTLALALSLPVSALAASYSDLEGHWAQEYMEDLADRGYFSGYEDGTMRPDGNITACETLALLSRFYSLDSDALELIGEDFADTVEDTVPSALSWAYDELEICLAAGILTETELESVDLSAEIEKEQFSLFLVRAMQLAADAASQADAELSYDDAADISAECVGSVAILSSAGIVKGDENNDFSPQLSLTRAVAATMVSRALSYVESKGISLTIDDYEGIVRTEGVISTVSGSKMQLACMDGFTREYTVSSSASVTVNGAAKSLSSVYVGSYAEVSTQDGSVSSVAIENDSDTKWVQGRISAIGTSGTTTTTRYIYVTDLESGDQTKYTIPGSIAISQDGTAVAFSSLKKNSFVTLKLDDGEVTNVDSVFTDCEISGSVEEIDYGTSVSFKIKNDDGVVLCFWLDISELPTILRGETEISIDRLNTGDTVAVTLESCEIVSIDVEGEEDTVTGVLTSVITTASGTDWVLKTADGSTMTLAVDENAGVYSGSSSILISDIQIGDTVSIVVYGDTITEIYLQSALSSADKVEGTALATDTSSKTITLLTSSGKLVYIDASSVVTIISATTGKTMKLSAIEANSAIVAYGEYSNSTTFVAVSIIVGG
jgi:hypothetical protein